MTEQKQSAASVSASAVRAQTSDEKSASDCKSPGSQEVVNDLRDVVSPGVARMEAITACMTLNDRVRIFFGVFLIAYAYGLDGTLRYTYETYATNSFRQHSLVSTVEVIRSVIAAAAQPTAAKIADVFGRVELICLSVFFYVVGTVIETSATDLQTFVGGSVIYQVGYTMVILLVEVIIADISSTRARLFFSYIPALPFLVNTWISGNVVDAILKTASWKWGIGMWCIIYPVCALPLILSLVVVSRRAKREGRLANYRSSFQLLGLANFSMALFWVLDVVGIVLLIAVFALILTPLTLAGGISSTSETWKQAHILAPLIVGVLCVPLFVIWELRAPHPLLPFRLMKDRGVWAPVGIAVFLNFAWTMQGDYLFTVLRVAFDFSVVAATRITSLYSFVSVITGVLLGLVVYKVRRLKIFIVTGTCLFMVAFGILIHYRGSADGASRAGLIGAQVLLGVAGGMFPYPAQASVQVNLKHEHVAVMTGVYLATYSIGSALGNTVSGALWTQLLPSALESHLAQINSTLATEAYGSPLTVIELYPIGTPERDAMVHAYQYIQRLLTITGICLSVPLIMFALLTRNPQLGNNQTLAKDSVVSDVEHDVLEESIDGAAMK
ncbi:hypothetical protein NLG97_g129 [Lecanicillium saksenae]|uniref:Uncharacterized protein n=1 Tax=Lecanicillium saksenae TaxID=468837 RepID=A0ACC1R822_9HYPO|nr:hypothetical protein NLG97_g129 [Lecanicillium saksenae]